MNPSLSVLLPLYNAEASLGSILGQLLDVLAELTPRFQVVIVDDGSTDATVEVADELVRGYPQLSMVVHPARLGVLAAVQTGLRYSRGELVLVRHEECRLDLHAIHAMWRRMAVEEVVFARSASRSPLGWIPRPPQAEARLAELGRPDLLMCRRRLLDGWIEQRGRTELLAFLAQQGYPLYEVELPGGPLLRPVGSLADRLRRRLSDKSPAAGRGSSAVRGATHAGRKEAEVPQPNYLERLKQFAWGE